MNDLMTRAEVVPMEFPPLTVEVKENGLIDLIDPTDTGDSFTYMVSLHPYQLQWLADKVLRRPVEATANLQLPQPLPTFEQQEDVAVLKWAVSRMLNTVDLIAGRTRQLRDNIISVQEDGHADMNIEVAQAGALQDIVEVFQEDLQALAARCIEPRHAKSRQVTQSHDEAPGVMRDAGVTSRDTADLSESASLDLFRRLVRENAANLRQVATWGDGVCGELLSVLQRELLGLPKAETPKRYSDDLIGIDWALSQKLDKSSQRFLLVVLAYRAKGDRVSLTTAEIAEMTGQDRKTVIEGLRGLADLGLISDTSERTGADGKVPVFRLTMEKRIGAQGGQQNLEGGE